MTQDLKNRIIGLAKDDLDRIESALKDNLNANLELVSRIAGHLIFDKGKRLRPLLFINSARICGFRDAFAVDFSTVFEYLHAATLLHDDVVDGADLRRGRAAAHTRWKAPEVVLTGDFLLARALAVAARAALPEVISVISRITEEMSQGEIDQLHWKGRLDLTEAAYMEIIRRKTAVLIEGACRSGGIVAGASEKEKERLSQYGYHLGIAFQMADDLLDYTADAVTLGKNPGADLREGKMTLPLIKSLERADRYDKTFMTELIGSECNESDLETLVEKLNTYNGIAYTEKKAGTHVAHAKEALDIFESSETKTLLTMLADYAVARKV